MSFYVGFILLAAILNSVIIYHKTKQTKMLFLTGIEYIGMIIGAKLLNIISEFEYYYYSVQNAELSWIEFLTTGYAYTGAIIGGILSIIIGSKLMKEDIEKILEIYVPNFLFMYAVSKIGCYLNSCCVGIDIENIKIPIQLIESVLGFVLYAINKNMNSQNRVASFFIFYGLLRGFSEFLREKTYIQGLSITFMITLVFVILGMVLYKRGRIENEKETII